MTISLLFLWIDVTVRVTPDLGVIFKEAKTIKITQQMAEKFRISQSELF